MGTKTTENHENEKQTNEVLKPPGWIGVRHTQMVLLFILIVIGYGMRVNLSVGIVAMTDPHANPDYNFPTYNWTDKSVILSSFFWGYILPQIGVGQLAERYGPKWFLSTSMTVSSIFTILIPFMAQFGSWGVMLCRVAQGFTQGFFFPCMHILLSKWVPLGERSRMGTFIYAGGPFGTVLALPITGWISASSIGWPSVFYIYGALGLFWVLLWIWLGASGPADHKTVTKEEIDYIRGNVDQTNEHVPTPWKHMAKSLPLWSILLVHCGQNWGFWTLLTEIPTYMGNVLDFNIKDNGLLSAAPYFALWILSFLFSYLADFSINKKIFSVGVTRKALTCIGLVGPAIALIFLGSVDDGQKVLAIGLLIVAVGLNSAVYCGYNVNHIDIAPTHAGTLMGITNGCANILSIIAPLLVQFVVTDESNGDQWRVVFYTASAIYVVANLIYTVFGSGELQYWDRLPGKDNTDKMEKELQNKSSEEKPSRF